MLQSHVIPGIQDENGAYFIDSCPKYFGIILNFLRRGVMEKVGNVDLEFLRNDAEYFCIQGLVKLVDKEIEKTEKGKALRLEQFKRVDENVTKIGSEIEKTGKGEALRLEQLRRIDENVTNLGSTVATVRGPSQGPGIRQMGPRYAVIQTSETP